MPAPSLGTLPWQPALDHLDLLATPTADAVRAAGADWAADCFVAPIADDLADTAAFCEAYGVPLEVSANCVVVSGRRAETTTLAACLVLATDRADVNKVVRQHLGVRKISFAPMAEATERSQMEYGGITPVGLPAQWPVLVDQAVVDQAWVVVGSGTRGSKLLLPGARLAELANAHVMVLRQTA
ncbi:MAG TPA: YbaK/EbsC family protein [Friedmanniella sp.]